MPLKLLRFLALMLAALSMSVAFAHLLEMGPKMRYEPALWLRLLQTLYANFGAVGGILEAVAVLAAVVLVFAVRKRGAAFAWTLTGAAAIAAAHAAYWIWVEPVNAALLPLTPETLPADWTVMRNQWEYTHASRALLQILGLAALVVSVLVETPSHGAAARQ